MWSSFQLEIDIQTFDATSTWLVNLPRPPLDRKGCVLWKDIIPSALKLNKEFLADVVRFVSYGIGRLETGLDLVSCEDLVHTIREVCEYLALHGESLLGLCDLSERK